ncbi:MAG: adenylyl-sulfate kinase [Sphingosinicella sp.]|nr:adenylyl-sulfate kinase [Sphingosinicella sp.]
MTSLLRLIACGSVDDGKSTLIGRLLHDCGGIYDDQLSGLVAASRRFGTQGGEVDLALLGDALEAEREQGITIDVAYRFFATPARKFILADAPGHEQYTRNMVTGASTADLAVVLVDAGKGILTQTRRHSYLAKLLGIGRVVLAVNKMDLVGWDRARFEEIAGEYRSFAEGIGIPQVTAIPLSALTGANVASKSDLADWYHGPALIEYLEQVDISQNAAGPGLFRMPVQWVSRPNVDFRGYAGTVVSGTVRPGDQVIVLPAETPAEIERIVTMDGELAEAVSGQSVTLTFTRPVECARGSVLSSAVDLPQKGDQFEAVLHWMASEDLLPGRQYLLKLATQTVAAVVQTPKYEINVDTLEHLACKTLGLNAIGVANIWADGPIIFEPYDASRDLGGFILIDRLSNATVAAGMINHALRRSINVHEQILEVTPESRAALKGQRPKLLWFTGLSGAGKSTIANIVERKLNARGRHTFLLDGDNLRRGLNKDLGFTDADRIENIRRAAETACLMMDAGLIVLTAFISPFRAERQMVREMVAEGDFVEIFVDTPLADAEARDVKGLYKKARAGELQNFTGLDSSYETPEVPQIRIDTMRTAAEEAADIIIAYLERL